jgi:quercetin dioxygenase-like cupin family protein
MVTCRALSASVVAFAGAAVMSASLMGAAPAAATPPHDVSAIILSQGTRDGEDFIVRDITIRPGGSTGWHWHQGRLFGRVLAGTLTHNRSDCSLDGVYQTGDSITETGGSGYVHVGRNLGADDLVLRVLYINPAGAPLSVDAPDPGCGFA